MTTDQKNLTFGGVHPDTCQPNEKAFANFSEDQKMLRDKLWMQHFQDNDVLYHHDKTSNDSVTFKNATQDQKDAYCRNHINAGMPNCTFYKVKHNNAVVWERIRITVFSMLVSASFFATYSITTFYTGVTVVAGGAVRLAFLMNTYKQWVYETTHPEPIIKVCEACYMYRHEKKLDKEEEVYRMLQEMMRMPDFVKTITGSSLKGSQDPIYDKFKADDKLKMENIEMLENKGFEVKAIKDKLLDKYKED